MKQAKRRGEAIARNAKSSEVSPSTSMELFRSE